MKKTVVYGKTHNKPLKHLCFPFKTAPLPPPPHTHTHKLMNTLISVRLSTTTKSRRVNEVMNEVEGEMLHLLGGQCCCTVVTDEHYGHRKRK